METRENSRDEARGDESYELERVDQSIKTSVTEKTLKYYYKELRSQQYAKQGTPSKPVKADLQVSYLDIRTTYRNTFEALRDGLLINSPDNIISQSRCELLESRLSYQRAELQTARKRISELEYKSTTDVSLERFNELSSRHTYAIKAKDDEISRLKAVIQAQNNEITALKAGCLINTADCEKKVLDARYEQYSRIVTRATVNTDDYRLKELQTKYADFLKRHETTLHQIGYLSYLVDELRQENTYLKLESLDLKKENVILKNKMVKAPAE